MNIKKVLVSTLGTAAVLGAGLFASTTSANADVRVSVKSGDTVAKIANQYNSSISAIESANSMKNVNLIYVGESLVVPSSASSTASTTTTATQSTTPSQSPQTTSNYSSNNTSANYSTQSTGTTSSASTTSSNSSSAKAWIANKESGGSYSARNGQYVGKYQLSASYLNGDYSAANQEKVANSYVSSRYGSWAAAKSFWQANGWY
ncbi:LysM peptidoglycan-binding domain-containing protein [Levilactobacillus tangyuanensis]|uniref:LysM peptidoglycan-binding domain-containing protein n=1 Tax=Levilactobacillus tangyuanensis TaxID=2486021 RepID=A0ABW1TQS4_9LACO|nr:LysM peptidoglycan-binding domain-containing protein [Levilactobacillus tangyuanensis]